MNAQALLIGIAARPTAPPPPVVVVSATDAAAVLTAERIRQGMTGEELDDHAGLADRYTIKLENPDKGWGKRGLHISPMWELWADALGMCLVIMPKAKAEEIGAIPAPRREPGHAARPSPLAGECASQ